jgi:hypothetical protein
VKREPLRPKSVRVPDALWLAAQAEADERGEVLSEEIRKFLERYLKRRTPEVILTSLEPGQISLSPDRY